MTTTLPDPSSPSYVSRAYERMRKGYRVEFSAGTWSIIGPDGEYHSHYWTAAEATWDYVQAAGEG